MSCVVLPRWAGCSPIAVQLVAGSPSIALIRGFLSSLRAALALVLSAAIDQSGIVILLIGFYLPRLESPGLRARKSLQCLGARSLSDAAQRAVPILKLEPDRLSARWIAMAWIGSELRNLGALPDPPI